MNWEAIGAVGEVGGAIAVVATLLYLAAQVGHARRQLDQQHQSTALQNVYDAWAPIFLEDNMNVLRRGMEASDDLNADEAMKFHVLMVRIVGVVLAVEHADQRARHAFLGSLNGLLTQMPGAVKWLEEARRDRNLAPMVALFDTLCSELFAGDAS